ncbi:MAG: nucleoside monophosphate kinase [Candidatus Liptonbacteria bacterium]|nr:nucleoside monophosphate kinase [Candidatus Liptonbacteria bacterium]
MRKIAIVLYGPPGSGKGTQANLLADKLGITHFDTGKFLEAVVHDPKRQREKVIKRERKNFDTGILVTPSFTLREVARETIRIGKCGLGIIFSGSPRTVYEASGLYPLFEKLYGKKNIYVFELKLSPEGSIERNSSRLVCSVCGYTLLTAYYPSKKPRYCPVCAGSFYRRTLDKPEVIKVRLKQYRDRTEPIFDLIKKHGYKVHQIDARPAPHKVLKKLLGYFG